MTSLPSVVGRLASVANTSSSAIRIVLVTSSCVVNIRILGINLDSLVICASILATT